MKTIKEVFNYHVRVLKFYNKYQKKYLIAKMLTSLKEPIKVLVSVILFRYLVDSVFTHRNVFIAFMIIFTITILELLSSVIMEIVNVKLKPISYEEVKKRMSNVLYNAFLTTKVKNAAKKDEFIYLTDKVAQKFDEIITNLFMSLSNIIALILLIYYLIDNHSVLLVLVSFLLFVFDTVFLPIISKIDFISELKLAPVRRINKYITWLIHTKEYQQELEDSDIQRLLFRKKSKNLGKTKDVLEKKWNKQRPFVYLRAVGSSYFQSGIILLVITYEALFKGLTIGLFTSLYNASASITENTLALSRIFPTMYEDSLFARKLYQFLDQQIEYEEKKEKIIKKVQKLVVKNLAITSLGSDKKIAISFKKGGYYVITGSHGVGKSKLLETIYESSYKKEGAVIDEDGELINNDQVLYIGQNSKILPFRLGKNISLKTHYDREKVISSLLKVDFQRDIECHPEQLDLYCTDEFFVNSLHLSSSEKKKVLFARSFATERPIILIDQLVDDFESGLLEKIYTELAKNKDKIIIVVSKSKIVQELGKEVINLNELCQS